MNRRQSGRTARIGGSAGDAERGPVPEGLSAEFDRVYKDVIRLARAEALKTVDYQTADDVAQTVGIKFWRLWQDDSGLADQSRPLAPFVGQAVRRTIMNLHRDQRRARENHDVYEGERGAAVHAWMDPHEAQSMAELAGVIQRAIDDMPERMRDTFRRVREGEESYSVVAAEQGVKERTVATQMVRANQAIRAAVFEYWKEGA